jgi:hypothetical protein
MTEAEQELDSRFIKLMLSSTLKTIELMHPDIDAQTTVRQHMLTICAGVRQRAVDSAPDGTPPEEATANVDALISTINEYFDYAASPMFPPVELVRK